MKMESTFEITHRQPDIYANDAELIGEAKERLHTVYSKHSELDWKHYLWDEDDHQDYTISGD